MHAAKKRKKATKLQKIDAQAKAHKRIKKFKQRRVVIATIMPPRDQTKALHPYIPIQVKITKWREATLANLGSYYK